MNIRGGGTVVAQATKTAAQSDVYVSFTFDMPQGANSIRAIVPINYGVSSTWSGITGVVNSGVNISNRTVTIRLFGTTAAQTFTCTALIIYD